MGIYEKMRFNSSFLFYYLSFNDIIIKNRVIVMNILDIITRKKNGNSLSYDELSVLQYLEYQMCSLFP